MYLNRDATRYHAHQVVILETARSAQQPAETVFRSSVGEEEIRESSCSIILWTAFVPEEEGFDATGSSMRSRIADRHDLPMIVVCLFGSESASVQVHRRPDDQNEGCSRDGHRFAVSWSRRRRALGG